MSVNLRNVSGVALIVNGRTVDVDEVLRVDGAVSKDSPDDGHLIGDRVYPASIWSAEPASNGKEND